MSDNILDDNSLDPSRSAVEAEPIYVEVRSTKYSEVHYSIDADTDPSKTSYMGTPLREQDLVHGLETYLLHAAFSGDSYHRCRELLGFIEGINHLTDFSTFLVRFRKYGGDHPPKFNPSEEAKGKPNEVISELSRHNDSKYFGVTYPSPTAMAEMAIAIKGLLINGIPEGVRLTEDTTRMLADMNLDEIGEVLKHASRLLAHDQNIIKKSYNVLQVNIEEALRKIGDYQDEA